MSFLVDWFKNNPQQAVGLGLGAAALGNQIAGGDSGPAAPTPQQTAANTLALDTATKNLGDARSTLQLPLDYWSKILSGNQGAALTAMAPQVNTITSQYDGALRAMNQLAPRGGGRNAGMQDLAFRKAGDITNLINSARPVAAGNVSDIGTRIGNLGTPALSIASSGANSAAGTGLTQEQINNQQNATLGTNLGTVLGILLGQKNNSNTTSGAQQDPFWAGRTTPPYIASGTTLPSTGGFSGGP